MATLPEMLRAEQVRCRQIATDYAALGSTGVFARALVEQALRAAEEATRLGNLTAMQRAVDGLRRFQALPPAQTHAPQGRAYRQPAGARAPAWVPQQEQFFTWTRRAA